VIGEYTGALELSVTAQWDRASLN